MRAERIVVVGASGFVGKHLCPALIAAGHEVRGTSRRPEKLRGDLQGVECVALDMDRPEQFEAALAGCTTAFFLVHRVGTGSDYAAREARTARVFARAAAARGLERIIYLGGVTPSSGGSRHLLSRANTGKILREGQVPTLELRAAMIIGSRSISWMIVRDLAARLPAMVLPKWLGNHSWPVDVDDVAYALVGALALPAEHGVWEVPGPQRLTHRDCLERTAAAMGRRTRMMRIPIVTPRLSSYWIALVTRVDLSTIRELVEGLRFELEPTGPWIWSELRPHELTDFDLAARRALQDERDAEFPSKQRLERLRQLGASLRTAS